MGGRKKDGGTTTTTSVGDGEQQQQTNWKWRESRAKRSMVVVVVCCCCCCSSCFLFHFLIWLFAVLFLWLIMRNSFSFISRLIFLFSCRYFYRLLCRRSATFEWHNLFIRDLNLSIQNFFYFRLFFIVRATSLKIGGDVDFLLFCFSKNSIFWIKQKISLSNWSNENKNILV